ncbi:hypothetical protein E2C01_039087 [Portunus trituberculatus]|uniref:Integrase zinc-binding domain-containing protein n=1 Tax=Portunus trituberculatus TaxID=210409 RepID=A0A5B7FJQ2_PORTR|nr:hypothetical protein [Portunus trituberculatus]
MEEAKLVILKATQKRPVQDKALCRFEHTLGTDGLIRKEGRLKQASLHPDQNNPVLLPRNERVTKLIGKDVYTMKVGHAGRENTLAAICEVFWIPQVL